VLIPLFKPDVDAVRRSVGRFREVRTEDGAILRFAAVYAEVDAERRCVRGCSRYERMVPGRPPEVLEREGFTSYWEQSEFACLLEEAGFTRVRAVNPAGGPASPDANVFVMLARKAG
jgi:hypothetical protein